MEKIGDKILNEKLRAEFLQRIGDMLSQDGEEILRTASNEICIPCLDEARNDKFVVVTIKVPTGSREGDAYDGYAFAEEYAMKVEANRIKAEEKKRKDDKKKAMDEARRAQLAKAKAEREAKKNEGK